jgi:hypothetical protein
MEKLQQLTAYEEFADNAHLIDKYVFLENINRLAEYDESYKEFADKLNNLTKDYIDIEPNIPYNSFIEQLARVYYCGNGLNDIPLYNLICKTTNIEVQECLDYEEIYKVIYNFYIENYNEFIVLIKKVLTPDGKRKWGIYIPKKVEESTLDYNSIPKVPDIPEL